MLFDRILESATYLKDAIKGFKPVFSIQLGTGLASISEVFEIKVEIPYIEIPNFLPSGVESHKGVFQIGVCNGVQAILLNGRNHYYEGHSMQDIVLPLYVLKWLGVRHHIATNASASVVSHIKAGDIVLISDHVNMMGDNPLRGPNDDRIGVRFPDMSKPYDLDIQEKLLQAAGSNSVAVHRGVYLALSGPNLETRSEYLMCQKLGADIIGMSTVPEVIAANHCKLPINAISVVSNHFDSQLTQPETIEKIIDKVKSTSAYVGKIISTFCTYYDSKKSS